MKRIIAVIVSVAVMLSLCPVRVAKAENIGTMIFDEVDTGISGATAQKIGIALKTLSAKKQILCVTHSAQVSTLADHHYLVEKGEKDGRTETDVTLLEGEEEAAAEEAFLELEEKGIKADVVVVDPPRKGLNADTIEALHKMSPRRIVYVSCDPATLARDVALLKERGYTLKNAMAADLFPRCAHVESVVCLTRKEVCV